MKILRLQITCYSARTLLGLVITFLGVAVMMRGSALSVVQDDWWQGAHSGNPPPVGPTDTVHQNSTHRKKSNRHRRPRPVNDGGNGISSTNPVTVATDNTAPKPAPDPAALQRVERVQRIAAQIDKMEKEENIRQATDGQSILAEVLERRQSDVRALDRKIKQAQDALRMLIRSNNQNETAREEWTKESLEASNEAKKLSLKLVLDLVGAHLDHVKDVGYQQVERFKNLTRLTGKVNDLEEKIEETRTETASKPKWEDAYDVVTQLKKVEELAGPSKDLLDSAYTIYRQAASVSRLSQIRDGQEKSLRAVSRLRRYIIQLEKDRHLAKARAAPESRVAAGSNQVPPR